MHGNFSWHNREGMRVTESWLTSHPEFVAPQRPYAGPLSARCLGLPPILASAPNTLPGSFSPPGDHPSKKFETILLPHLVSCRRSPCLEWKLPEDRRGSHRSLLDTSLSGQGCTRSRAPSRVLREQQQQPKESTHEGRDEAALCQHP